MRRNLLKGSLLVGFLAVAGLVSLSLQAIPEDPAQCRGEPFGIELEVPPQLAGGMPVGIELEVPPQLAGGMPVGIELEVPPQLACGMPVGIELGAPPAEHSPTVVDG